MGDNSEIVAGRSVNRNNWFTLRKLQHTKRFLPWSRHFLFLTSRTEREREKSGIAHAMKTWIPSVSFHGETCFWVHFQSSYGPMKPPIILVHAVFSLMISANYLNIITMVWVFLFLLRGIWTVPAFGARMFVFISQWLMTDTLVNTEYEWDPWKHLCASKENIRSRYAAF
jgi:hypothetical protein